MTALVMSDYLEGKVIDYVLRNDTFTSSKMSYFGYYDVPAPGLTLEEKVDLLWQHHQELHE